MQPSVRFKNGKLDETLSVGHSGGYNLHSEYVIFGH